MKDYLDDFSSYLTTIKNSSENTKASYLRDVQHYCDFLTKKKVLDPKNADQKIVTSYLKELSSRGKSGATIIRTKASIKSFYCFLMQFGVIVMNPASGIKTSKAEHKMPQILSSEEVELLLNQPDTTDYKGIRDKAMLELLYATGIRVTELLNLNIDDVNLEIGFIKCKNNRGERIIPIYPSAVAALKAYLRQAKAILLSDVAQPSLFVNIKGERMTRQGFFKIVKYYQEKAGIKKQITPHTLRHSFAMHLIQNGADLESVKEMLGHADISSTQFYARIIKQQISDVYTRCHPRAQ
ncbi:MAG: tyrosine recombinase [Clostridiales bacterium]|nr:tyrosine recombinase [Clostridiales bacterium]